SFRFACLLFLNRDPQYHLAVALAGPAHAPQTVEDCVALVALRRRIALGHCRQHSAPQARIDRPVDKRRRASHPLPLPPFTSQRCDQGELTMTQQVGSPERDPSKPGWTPVCAMPNVTLDEPVEASCAALVPCSDERIRSIFRQR